MARGRCTAVQSRPTEFLVCTSVTFDAFPAAGPPFRGGVPCAYGGVAPRWETPDGLPVYRRQKLPPAEAGRPVVEAGHPRSGYGTLLCPAHLQQLPLSLRRNRLPVKLIN